MHHCYMCLSPNSFHRLYLPVLLLSANTCVYQIAYVYTRTPLLGEPPPLPSTHIGSVSLYAHNHTDQNKKRLKQNLPRSLHKCLDASNNGMFQGQRSRDIQLNARTRAHVRMETCLPRAHLFICLVYYHMQSTKCAC